VPRIQRSHDRRPVRLRSPFSGPTPLNPAATNVAIDPTAAFIMSLFGVGRDASDRSTGGVRTESGSSGAGGGGVGGPGGGIAGSGDVGGLGGAGGGMGAGTGAGSPAE